MEKTIEELEEKLNDIRILKQEAELYNIRILIQQAETEYERVIRKERVKEYIQLEEVQEVIIEYQQSKLGKERFKKNQQYNIDYRNSERGKEIHKKYCQSEKFKMRCNRRRELGFVPLNLWFDGSEAHHLDEEKVLYIPKEIHRSIYHDVYGRKNMSEINDIALEWFKNHSKR